MLPVPQPQRLPASTDAPSRRRGATGRLFVERRATRRQPPQRERARRLRPQWLLAAVAPIVLVAAYAIAGIAGAAVVGLGLLLAAQAFAISALRTRAARLDQLSRTDELTGLGNSRALWSDLRELASATPVALIMLDLDHFKRVNDEYGHSVGDALLRHAGRAMRVVAGDIGNCYRYGGEELVAVLPGMTEESACAVAERLRAIIVRPPRDLPRVTASAGVAVGTPGASVHQLVDRADRALRFAKSAGRDRTVPATLAEDWAADHEDSVVAARRAALAMATAALDARDPDTAEHSDEVVMLCDALASRLGIEGRDREHLLTAARLHDVGKVAVPHDILAKPAELDTHEWEIMREHTITGERILCSVPELAPVAPIVRHAHERYDGGGYPDGLAGEQIPLASRVILCADAFHAIRSDRPYRAARSVDEALQELIDNAGGQFDPDVAASLVSVVTDVREQKSVATLKAVVRRSPRLLALMMALAVASSAFAANRPLRTALGGVLPGLGSGSSSATSSARPPAAPATCATITLEGTVCSHKLAALGPLTIAAPASPGAPPAPASQVLLYEPAHDQFVTVGDFPIPMTPERQQTVVAAVGPAASTTVAGALEPADHVESVGDAAPAAPATTPPAIFAPTVDVVDPPAEQVVGDDVEIIEVGPVDQAPVPDPAPDPAPDQPGNNETAPGQLPDPPADEPIVPSDEPVAPVDEPGNSENAPGQDPAGPGNSENAPGQDIGTALPAAPADTIVAETPPTPAVLPVDPEVVFDLNAPQG